MSDFLWFLGGKASRFTLGRRWAVMWDGHDILSRHWRLDSAQARVRRINDLARERGFSVRVHLVDVRQQA